MMPKVLHFRKTWVIAGVIVAFAAGVLLCIEYGWLSRQPVASTPSQSVDIQAVRAKAEAGDAPAQAQLGRLCLDDVSLTNRFAEAARWFGRGAEQGNADAQTGMAELYEAGRGVDRNPAKAIEFYQLAAKQGHATAQYALGFAYLTGRGVPQDQVEATKWFRMAAEQGNPLAQYDLGQRYMLGLGVALDQVEAMKWFTLAADQGQPDAAQQREILKKTMGSSDIAEAKRRAAGVQNTRGGR